MKKLFPLLLTAAAVATVYVLKKSKEIKQQENINKEEEKPQEYIEIQQILTKQTEEVAEEKSEQLDQLKLLNIQIDLVMNNYPDERIFLLQHHILYDNHDKLMELTNELKENDYFILDGEDGLIVEKIILQKEDEIKDAILSLAVHVREDGGIYKGFNVIPQ